MNFEEAYQGKVVFITGHTGFKGAWLCEWLLSLGSEVVGYALEPPTTPALFTELGLHRRVVADIRKDVRSLEDLQGALQQYKPDFVFHLAAQPVVRLSFDEPFDTASTNFNGTLNVLEAVRRENRGCAVVMITTDKVYENKEWLYAYREVDELGGHDPYSASKACADIMISSYQRSFFNPSHAAEGPVIAVAQARGGNVIGGGDWALDRIVPDAIRSLSAGQTIPIRNRHALRAWQHVLELLSGYLTLGAALAQASERRDEQRLHELCAAFNFGPNLPSNRTVKVLVEEILEHWSGHWNDFTDPRAAYEAGKLNLTIDKAYHKLSWQPRWTFEEAVCYTVDWYKQFYEAEARDPNYVQALTQRQIAAYEQSCERLKH